MSIGQEIKEYRKMTRLTQQAFGRLMEVSGPTVSRWERGIDVPTKENLAQIQVVFDKQPPMPPEGASVDLITVPQWVFELYEFADMLEWGQEFIELISGGATIAQLRSLCYLADNERLEEENNELRKEIEAQKDLNKEKQEEIEGVLLG